MFHVLILGLYQHDSAFESLHLSVNVAEVDAPEVELAHLMWIPINPPTLDHPK